MSTSHSAHGTSHYGEPGAHHEPVPVDPEHDIDAKSATWWVVGGTVVLFVSLWLMVPIFVRVQEAERRQKVDQAPNVELQETLAAERRFLEGANPTKKSIDSVIAQRTGK